MKINNTVVAFYRSLAFVLLSLYLVAVIGYVALIGVYIASRSWAAPLTLSPSQERVLAFQPQVANLESNLLKQRVELQAAEAKLSTDIVQLDRVSEMLRLLDGAQKTESRQLARTNVSIGKLLKDKRANIAETEKTIADAKAMLKTVDDELAAGLITRDTAQGRRISLQAAINSATDARTAALALQEQARVARSGSRTLAGKEATSLVALQSLQEALSLRALHAQLTVETETARLTVEQLKTAIADGVRVLEVAKTSPYHLALRQSVSVVFVPYDNLKNVVIGESIYDCYLHVIVCRKVGVVERLYEAEEYARHPLFKTDLKGRLVMVKFDLEKASQSQVVFIGGKPLFL